MSFELGFGVVYENKPIYMRMCLFQIAIGLLIAFSASVEGFVIKMKPAAPVPEDNTIKLSYLNQAIINYSKRKSLAKIHESKIKKSL